jgi:sulfonate transport system substrate-binding protein
MHSILTRRRLLHTGGLSAAGILAGCKKSSAAVTLTLGDQKGGMQSLLELSGQLTGLTYTIQWAQFAAAAPLFEALNANAIDAGIGGDAPFVFFLATQPAAQAVAALNYKTISQNEAGILVRPDSNIQGIHDLVGKRVAVVRGSTGQYVTLAALKQAGLPLDAVNFVFLEPSDSLTTLLGGGVDGWGSWEPYMSLGELHYGLQRLPLQLNQLQGLGFMVATTQAISDKQAALQDFLARFGRARVWAAANKPQYTAGFAKDTGLPLDVAQRYVEEANYNVVPIDAQAIANVQALADLYLQAKLLRQPLTVSSGFDPGFLTVNQNS